MSEGANPAPEDTEAPPTGDEIASLAILEAMRERVDTGATPPEAAPELLMGAIIALHYTGQHYPPYWALAYSCGRWDDLLGVTQ